MSSNNNETEVQSVVDAAPITETVAAPAAASTEPSASSSSSASSVTSSSDAATASSSATDDALPPQSAAPGLRYSTSIIELDTSRAKHVPHKLSGNVNPPTSEDGATASGASSSSSSSSAPSGAPEKVFEEDEDSDPLSEIDEMDAQTQHDIQLQRFLAALQGGGMPIGMMGPDGFASSDDVFSEPENAAAAPSGSNEPERATSELHEYLRRQHNAAAAAAAHKAATSPTSSSSGPRSASEKAAARAAKKAEFDAKVAAKRAANRGMDQQEDEDEEEPEEATTPRQHAPAKSATPRATAPAAAASSRATPNGPADEDDEDEYDDGDEEEGFGTWLKNSAINAWQGRTASKVRSTAEWLGWKGLEWTGKSLYVVGVVALMLVPVAVAEINEQNYSSRAQRLESADIPMETKIYIWQGVKPSPDQLAAMQQMQQQQQQSM